MATTTLKTRKNPIAFQGFLNIFRRESSEWWRGRRWIRRSLLMAVGINSILAFTLFVLPETLRAEGETIDLLETATQFFFGLSSIVLSIQVIIRAQESILGEKESGVSAWVLSKPVSRRDYVLAKFCAHLLTLVLLLISFPSLIAFGLMQIAGVPLTAGDFTLGVLILTLHTVFYLALTFFLGIVSPSRSMLLGLALGSALGGSMLVNLLGSLTIVTPWPLPNIATALASGAELPTTLLLPIGFTLLWSLLLIWQAVARFEKAEL